MLDSVGFFDEMIQHKPEEILEFSDWMGIPMTPYPVTLDRLLGLLLDEVKSKE
jgi:hypothetical protein